MSCTFNKYRNALGVYRVVIDSVLSSAIQNNSVFKSDLHLPNLIDYFKDFQYKASDVEDFVQLALDSVIDSYNLALETLSDNDMTDQSSLSVDDEKTLRNNFKTQLEKLYKLDPEVVKNKALPQEVEVVNDVSTVTNPNSIVVGGIQPVANKTVDVESWSRGSIKIAQNLDIDPASIESLSDLEFNYYAGAATASRKMLRDLTKKVFNIRILQPLKSNSSNATKTVNKDIRDYKNELFSKLVTPLNLNIKESQKVLYDDLGNMVQPNYAAILDIVKSKFKMLNGGLGVRAYDLLSWSSPTNANSSLIDQYNAFVILSNFDTLVDFRSGGTLRAKENYKGQETSADKYILTATNKMRTGYSDDTIVHSDDETTKLFKMFVETIPMIKMNGSVSGNIYLSTRQVHNTFGKLKSEIDNSDPIGSLEAVVIDALSNFENRGGRGLTSTDMSTLLSLYSRIFKTSNNDSKISQSGYAVSEVIRKINQSGQFETSESITSLFNNIHTTGQDINFLDLLANNIAKVDLLSYNEVVFSPSDNTYVIKNLANKVSNRQRSNLRSGIGGSLLFRTSSNIDAFNKQYHLKNGGTLTSIFLNGKTIVHDAITGALKLETADGKLQDIENISQVVNVPNVDIESADIFQIDGDIREFADYKQIVNNFEKIFNQALSSDNYKMLDIFRAEIDGTDEATQGQHVKTMLELIGNYAYLANLNASTINGSKNITSTDAKNLLTTSPIDFKSIWDSGQRRYKIDFNKAGKGALEDFAEVMNNYYGSGIKSVTKNTEGNFVPTSSLMSPINRYRDLITDLKSSNDVYTSPLSSNYLITNDNVANPLIKGTTIRSGIKSKKGDVVSPSKLNVKELLETSILHEFLEGKLSDDATFSIQPTNYADKSKQNTLAIDGNAYVNYWNASNNTWSQPVQQKTITSNDLANTYFKTIGDQYSQLGQVLSEDYARLFDNDVSGMPYVLASFLNKDAKELSIFKGITLDFTYDQLPENLVGDDSRAEYEKFNTIRQLISDFQSEQDYKKRLKLTDAIFSNMSKKSLIDSFKTSDTEYISNISFEVNVNTKKLGINSSLLGEIDNYTATGKSLEANKKSIEDAFLKSLNDENFSLETIDNDLVDSKLLNKAAITYNLSNEFKTNLISRGRLELADSKGNLNPILKDYLWNSLLIGRNFQFLTVGTPLGHPAKIKLKSDKNGKLIPATHKEIMASRLVAQNKRMVIHPATMHPYAMNLINGIGFKTKKIFVEDPAATVFNLTGTVEDIDAVDGSSYYLTPTTNMHNVSLLDQKVGLTHKSISGTMNTRTGTAGFTKHAAFTMTNENIRNSDMLESIVRSMLSNRMNEFAGFNINIDLTKDYNKLPIDINNLVGEVSFTVSNLNTLSEIGSVVTSSENLNIGAKTLLTLESMVKLEGDNQYALAYKVNGSSTDKVLLTANIETYDSLWQALGGKNSVSYSDSNLGNNPNSILDGYVNSNTSWDALTEYINRVGFWYNTEEDADFNTLYDMIKAPEQFSAIKKQFNSLVHNPNNSRDERSPETDRLSQKNIIQPLKLNFVGEITFNSGQKVGSRNTVSLDNVVANNYKTSYESNLHNGIQLNSDKESDGAEVTEQTQIISTLSFTGDTPEYPKKVFNSINNYINKNLGDLIQAVNDPNYTNDEALQKKVMDLVKQIVVKTFDDKDVDSLANSLIQVIKRESATKLESNLNLPISSPDLYNAVNTAVANFFTKEGIRRKMPGMAAVAKPYSQLIKFKRLPNGETVSQSEFEKWQRANPTEQQFTKASTNFINIYDTVIDPEGNSIYINDPATYIRLKKKMREQPGDYRIDRFADRELGSTHHTFKIENVGVFNYFDIDLVALPHFLDDVKTTYNKLKNLKGKLNKVLSPSQIERFGTVQELYNETINDLVNRVDEYNQTITSSNINFPLITLDTEYNPSYTSLNKTQNNTLRNELINLFKNLHDNKIIRAPLNSGLEGDQAVSEIKTVYGEVAMSFPHFSTFGLNVGQDISEVSESFFLDKLNRGSLPLTRVNDLYMKNSDGDHLHILLNGSENHKHALMFGGLEPVTFETVNVDGKTFTVDEYGKPKELVGYDTLYRGIIDGKMVDYVIVENLNDANKLKEMINFKGSKYDMIVPNFQAGVENLPRLIEFAANGVFRTNLDKLNKLYELYKTGDVEGVKDYIDFLDVSRYNDPEKLASQLADTNKLLAGKLSISDRTKLTYKKQAIESYFDYANSNDIDFNNPTPELKDHVREIAAIEIGDWVERKNKYLSNNDVSVTDDLTNALTKMQEDQLTLVERFNKRKATATYASFLKSLEVTTARIPGQDFQSYAGMKVVQFFHDEENVIYVPPRFQWTTGGDFDIDKVFTMFHSVGNDGLISGWSSLFNKEDSEFLETSLRMPVPNGNITTIQDVRFEENGLTFNQLTSIINHVNKGPKEYADRLSNFKTLVTALQNIDLNDGIVVKPIEQGLENIDLAKVIDFVNWFNTESSEVRDQKGATLNAIFTGVKDSITDLRNIVNAYLPVTFGDYQAKASLSKKGEQMSEMSYENPTDIFRAQKANMVGKEVIGVSASSGLKAFSVLSNVMMNVLEGGSGINMKTFDVPVLASNEIRFVKGSGIKGINFNNNIPAYKEYLLRMFGLSNEESDFVIDNMKKSGSLSLDLSAILSAATDNAKELILGRINAEPETVGYYLAAAMLGIDVDTIATIMTSDTVESIVALASRDIYKDRNINFKSALKQIADGKLYTKNYLDFNKVGNIVTAVENLELIGKKTATQLVEEELISKGKNDKEKQSIRTSFEYLPVRKNPNNFLDTLMSVIAKESNSSEIITKIGEALDKHKSISISSKDFNLRRIRNFKLDENSEYGLEEFETSFEENSSIYDDSMEMDMDEMMYGGYDEMYAEFLQEQYSKKENSLRILFTRYADDFDRLITKSSKDKSILKALDTLSKAVTDLNTLAKITSVNQRVKNTYLDLKKFAKTIQDYTLENYTDGVYEKGSNTDSLIDLLDVVDKTPHMKSMVNAALSAFNLFKKMSVKTRTIDDVYNKYSSIKLNPETFAKINSATEDMLITKVLHSLDNNDTTFTIMNGSSLSSNNEVITNNVMNINVKELEGRINFVDWMENQVIPDLKLGKVKIIDRYSELVEEIVDPSIEANEFLKRLTVDLKNDIIDNSSYTYYRIPIDMLSTDSETDLETMDMLKINFAKLEGESYMGKNITDLFFLYNLIVNRGKVSSTSFNPLLDGLSTDYSDNSLMTKYVRLVGEFDKNRSNLIGDNETLGFEEMLAKRAIGLLMPGVPMVGTDTTGLESFIHTKEYDANEGRSITKSYVLTPSGYIEVKPNSSYKYMDSMSSFGENGTKYIDNVNSGILRDKLNSLIAKANKKIIEC